MNLPKSKKLIIWSIIIFALCWGGFFIYDKTTKLINIYDELKIARTNLESIKKTIKELDFEKLNKEISQAEHSFSFVSNQIKEFNFVKAIPYVGDQVSAGQTYIDVTDNLFKTLNQFIKITTEIVSPLKKGNEEIKLSAITPAQKKDILAKMVQMQPQANGTKAQIELSLQLVRATKDYSLVTQLQQAQQMLADYLQKAEKLASKINAIVEILPSLVGYDRTKTYLFLLQNNAEMRGSGGFIGNYGILKLQGGEIVDFKTYNVYNLDYPAEKKVNVESPKAWREYAHINKLYLRDSNWSPDFTVNAQKALWFYQQEGGSEKNIDGVVAITPDIITSLLKIVGEIEVEGVKFNSDNFISELEYQVEKGYYQKGIPENQRKEIIGKMSKILIDRLFNVPHEKWPDLWRVLSDAIEEKDLLVYFNDQNLQKVAEQENWSGKVVDNGGDYLMVVDTNVLSMKTDMVMKKEVSYKVNQELDGLYATVKLRYTNNGQFSWLTTRYRDWVRIYVPNDSKLIELNGAMKKELSTEVGEVEVGQDLNKTYFGAYWVIEPKETKEMIIRYKLPDQIKKQVNNGKYSLYVQKQSGSQANSLNIDLNFNRAVMSIMPEDINSQGLSATNFLYSTDTLVDREIKLSF